MTTTSDTDQQDRISHRELTRLKWLATIVPSAAVLLYEFVRYETLEHLLPGIPPEVGNVIVGLVLLLLTYGFASFVFRVVERVQAQAVLRGREVAALNAVMDERTRLSRELHDGMAQLVAYLLVRVDTVAGLVQADRRPEAVAELERLRSVADDLYLDVREAIAGLRGRVSERGLLPVLKDYLDEFEERYGVPVAFETDDATVPVPDLVGMHLFRIVQEALANVRKHAHAHLAWVSLRHTDAGVLEVEIGDDGIGFDSDQEPSSTPRSFGLSSIDPGRVNHRLVCRQRRHYLAVRPTRVPCRYGQPATWLATGPTVSVATEAASQRRRSWAQRRAGLESNGHGAPASWADPIEVRRRQTTHTPTVQTHDHQGLRVLTSDRPDAGTRRSTAS